MLQSSSRRWHATTTSMKREKRNNKNSFRSREHLSCSYFLRTFNSVPTFGKKKNYITRERMKSRQKIIILVLFLKRRLRKRGREDGMLLIFFNLFQPEEQKKEFKYCFIWREGERSDKNQKQSDDEEKKMETHSLITKSQLFLLSSSPLIPSACVLILLFLQN